ncbi:hypothetical protein [Desulfobulbus elongatus]|uniref:hypothetical protein n=1 Tax=Desulfobulbus elongatus TaxID=53332 RepID=UPI0012F9EAF3|nr:hypothetical protein [Desulfobulbus elongatus]
MFFPFRINRGDSRKDDQREDGVVISGGSEKFPCHDGISSRYACQTAKPPALVAMTKILSACAVKMGGAPCGRIDFSIARFLSGVHHEAHHDITAAARPGGRQGCQQKNKLKTGRLHRNEAGNGPEWAAV